MNEHDSTCPDSACENHYSDFSQAEVKPVELEIAPTQAGQDSAATVLAEIRGRSFSGRHPELGRMIKCQVCRSRHRSSTQCEQKFATGRYDLRDPKPLLVAAQTRKGVLGAAMFAKKRLHPHPNKRKLQFVELVRQLLPDEYTQEELQAARNKATKVLVKKFGRRGFLFPSPKKEECSKS